MLSISKELKTVFGDDAFEVVSKVEDRVLNYLKEEVGDVFSVRFLEEKAEIIAEVTCAEQAIWIKDGSPENGEPFVSDDTYDELIKHRLGGTMGDRNIVVDDISIRYDNAIMDVIGRAASDCFKRWQKRQKSEASE